MDTEIRRALKEEILSEIDHLGGLEVGTDQFKTTTEGVTKLLDRLNEMDRLEAEQNEKEKTRNQTAEFENKKLTEAIKTRETNVEIEKAKLDAQKKGQEDEKFHRNAALAEERRSRIINTVITVGGLILNVGLTVWGTKKTLKFEETGTVTTQAGRNFIGRLFRKH